MSDLVTSETVTEEVQPETQVKFRNHVTFSQNREFGLPIDCKVQVVIN